MIREFWSWMLVKTPPISVLTGGHLWMRNLTWGLLPLDVSFGIYSYFLCKVTGDIAVGVLKGSVFVT